MSGEGCREWSVVTDVRMYIPISKEAPVLGMGPSDTERPLLRERETSGLAKWCQCSLSD